MKIRIDYLNEHREVCHSFHEIYWLDECELLGMDIRDALSDWATDMHIYKIIP